MNVFWQKQAEAAVAWSGLNQLVMMNEALRSDGPF
jgi:hypothetical protein